MTEENKNQNQLEEDFNNIEEELFDIEEEDGGQSLEKEFTPKQSSQAKTEEQIEEEGQEDKEVEEERTFLNVDPSLTGEREEEQKEEAEESLQPGGENDKITISRSKLVVVQKLIRNIKENNDKLEELLGGLVSEEDKPQVEIVPETEEETSEEEDSTIIEGVFDGENMTGEDGQKYTVPANYSSKSKLVEGDMLKLTITPDGGFVYKQIELIERKRKVGTLEKTKDGGYAARIEDKVWKLNTASVTYFKGESGDEVIFLVPAKEKSKYAAVENIVKR